MTGQLRRPKRGRIEHPSRRTRLPHRADYGDIERCLIRAEAALARARTLLIQALGDGEMSCPIAASQSVVADPIPAPTDGNGSTIRPDDALLLRHAIIQARYHLDQISPACARVLLALLEQPGKFLYHAELAQATGSHKQDGASLKVHIHNLRKALANHGLQTVIVTGRHSYAMRAEYADRIKDLLGID